MKKYLALLLVALMVVPFGVFASADTAKLTLPEMPVASTNIIGYAAASNTAGTVPDGATVTPSAGWDPVNYPATNQLYELFHGAPAGGTVVACGKLYVGGTCTVVATPGPIRFTAVDEQNNKDYRSKNDDGSYLVATEEGKNAGQIGMFMIISTSNTPGGTATFMGDVIFDNICILDRSPSGMTTTSNLEVGATGKMVITNTVDFLSMNGINANLSVQEGGYLFLDALGFNSVKGAGVIVLGDSIKDKVTADTFKGFGGIVCSSDGTVVYDLKGSAPADTQAPETTAAPAEEGNGAMVWIIVAIAAAAVVAVVVIVVIKKKKAQ